jgi:integrase
MPLSDTACRNAKPKEKPYKLADEKALYLEVMPTGAKYWRMKYRIDGKEKRLAIGVYPDVGLKEARDKRDDARKLLASGIDPSENRKAEKATQRLNAENSFEAVAREWFSKFSAKWTEGHSSKIIARLERDVFPWIGGKAIAELKARDVLAVLQRIEQRGAIETAHRAGQNCGQIFRYAIATGRAETNPVDALKGALAPVNPEHHPSVTDPVKIGELLRAIQGYQGDLATRCALKLAPLVFVRPGELRKAEWAEIDLAGAEWRIPAEKMKMRAVHIVPLSSQAVAILAELQPLTGRGKYVFPGVRDHERPMSENTINAALRRMGYTSDQMTGHGFRSMASTLLNEQGWHRDAIERQLAHAERDSVRAAYNYAEHLPERKRMMQAWADYLDGLAAGAVVIPFKRAG